MSQEFKPNVNWIVIFAESGPSTSLRFAYKEIWMPDVIAYNDIGVYDSWKYEDLIFLTGAPNGTITWTHPAPMKTTCNLDVTNFPYDSHECEIILASWQYTNAEVKFKCNRDHVDVGTFAGSMQWAVKSKRLQTFATLLSNFRVNFRIYWLRSESSGLSFINTS